MAARRYQSGPSMVSSLPNAIEIAATDRRVVGLVLASSFARHPLPTQFAAFARLLDLRWIPTRVVVAALMGSAGTPKLKAHLREVLAEVPRRSFKGGLKMHASRRQGPPIARDQMSFALLVWAFGSFAKQEACGRNRRGTAGLRSAMVGGSAHAFGNPRRGRRQCNRRFLRAPEYSRSSRFSWGNKRG